MTPKSVLEQFAHDIADVIPDVDAMAEHHRWQPGIGAFDEEDQVQRILEILQEQTDYYESIEIEVPYPDSSQRCDILIEREGLSIPIEAKLLRFYRDNGDIEPSAYTSIFSPFSNSVVTDAKKLAESSFEISGGLLGLYYEPTDGNFAGMDAETLAEKVIQDVDYWYDLQLNISTIARISNLRHPVHQQGAVIMWEPPEQDSFTL